MDLGIAGRTAIICASSKGLGKGCAMALAGRDRGMRNQARELTKGHLGGHRLNECAARLLSTSKQSAPQSSREIRFVPLGDIQHFVKWTLRDPSH